MIDARSADLDGGGFADMQALKAYLYKVDGALFALSAHVLGEHRTQTSRRRRMRQGPRTGWRVCFAHLPRDAAAGRVMLPLATLNEHNVLAEQILAGEEERWRARSDHRVGAIGANLV